MTGRKRTGKATGNRSKVRRVATPPPEAAEQTVGPPAPPPAAAAALPPPQAPNDDVRLVVSGNGTIQPIRIPNQGQTQDYGAQTLVRSKTAPTSALDFKQLEGLELEYIPFFQSMYDINIYKAKARITRCILAARQGQSQTSASSGSANGDLKREFNTRILEALNQDNSIEILINAVYEKFIKINQVHDPVHHKVISAAQVTLVLNKIRERAIANEYDEARFDVLLRDDISTGLRSIVDGQLNADATTINMMTEILFFLISKKVNGKDDFSIDRIIEEIKNHVERLHTEIEKAVPDDEVILQEAQKATRNLPQYLARSLFNLYQIHKGLKTDARERSQGKTYDYDTFGGFISSFLTKTESFTYCEAAASKVTRLLARGSVAAHSALCSASSLATTAIMNPFQRIEGNIQTAMSTILNHPLTQYLESRFVLAVGGHEIDIKSIDCSTMTLIQLQGALDALNKLPDDYRDAIIDVNHRNSLGRTNGVPPPPYPLERSQSASFGGRRVKQKTRKQSRKQKQQKKSMKKQGRQQKTRKSVLNRRVRKVRKTQKNRRSTKHQQKRR